MQSFLWFAVVNNRGIVRHPSVTPESIRASYPYTPIAVDHNSDQNHKWIANECHTRANKKLGAQTHKRKGMKLNIAQFSVVPALLIRMVFECSCQHETLIFRTNKTLRPTFETKGIPINNTNRMAEKSFLTFFCAGAFFGIKIAVLPLRSTASFSPTNPARP